MTKIRASITAVNGWVPEYILSNKELEKLVDTNDEWITSRTGIKERRILKGEGLGTSDIGVKAVEGLLKKKRDWCRRDRVDNLCNYHSRYAVPCNSKYYF